MSQDTKTASSSSSSSSCTNLEELLDSAGLGHTVVMFSRAEHDLVPCTYMDMSRGSGDKSQIHCECWGWAFRISLCRDVLVQPVQTKALHAVAHVPCLHDVNVGIKAQTPLGQVRWGIKHVQTAAC